MFEICGSTPLFSESNVSSYSGIAFDGCNYYLTVKCEKKIVKLNKCFQCVEVFQTCRIYSCICYDICEGCFWATSAGCYSEVYKLNCALKEIDHIRVKPSCGAFSGVSYYCEDNSLLVSTENEIFRIDKMGNIKCKDEIRCPNAIVTGVTAIAPCCLYHYINGVQRLRIVGKDGCVLEESTPPKGYIVEQALY
ncbi:MAG: hypothetical protein RSD68_06570, partial [Oscillospiraceae bacterium]